LAKTNAPCSAVSLR